MIEVTSKEFKFQHSEDEGWRDHEQFIVRGRSERPVTLIDVKDIAGGLILDLADLQPPLPQDFVDNIEVETCRHPEDQHSYEVSASYVRSEGSSTNASELGYRHTGSVIFVSPATVSA